MDVLERRKPGSVSRCHIFRFVFIALLSLDRLSAFTLLSDDLVKTKFTLIAGVSRAFPV